MHTPRLTLYIKGITDNHLTVGNSHDERTAIKRSNPRAMSSRQHAQSWIGIVIKYSICTGADKRKMIQGDGLCYLDI